MDSEESEDNTASKYTLTDILKDVLNHKSKVGKMKLDLSGSIRGPSALNVQRPVSIQAQPTNKENSRNIEKVVFPNVPKVNESTRNASASHRSSVRNLAFSTNTPLFKRSSSSDSRLYTPKKISEEGSVQYDPSPMPTFKSIKSLHTDHPSVGMHTNPDNSARPPLPRVKATDDDKVIYSAFKPKLPSNMVVQSGNMDFLSREKSSSDGCIVDKQSSASSTDRLSAITEFDTSDDKPRISPLDLLNLPNISSKIGAEKYNRYSNPVKHISKVEFPSKGNVPPFSHSKIKKITAETISNCKPTSIHGKTTMQSYLQATEKISHDANTALKNTECVASSNSGMFATQTRKEPIQTETRKEPIAQQRIPLKRSYPDIPREVWRPKEDMSPPKKFLVEKPIQEELRNEIAGPCAEPPKIDVSLLPSKVSDSMPQLAMPSGQMEALSTTSLRNTDDGAKPCRNKTSLRTPPFSLTGSSKAASPAVSDETSSPQLSVSIAQSSRPTLPCPVIAQPTPQPVVSAVSAASKHSQERPPSSTPVAAAVPQLSTAVSHISTSNPNSIPFDQSKFVSVNDHHFIKQRKIGVGGSSIVISVLDLQDYQNKALKIVKLENLDESMVKSHLDEIKVLQKLQKSARVVRLYEFEKTEDELKIVMEIGSLDLAAILRNARKNASSLNAFTIKHYWNEMLLSVQDIHEEGVIHSDLKPANFLLVGGTLKLIDFGIASAIQKDMTSVVKDNQAGTLNYMSPESLTDIDVLSHDNQAHVKIGVKSDIWSLGCILYVLAYGKTPFQHVKNIYQKIKVISNPKTPIEFPPTLSDDNLVDVLRKCLQYNPKNRPSIRELLDHPYLKSG